MDAAGEELGDRIRALLGGEPGIEEKRMFGTRAFLRDGAILAGARKNGVLLVRVAADQVDVLRTEPGVEYALMGKKVMTGGWLDVDAEVIADDADLMRWLDEARENLAGR